MSFACLCITHLDCSASKSWAKTLCRLHFVAVLFFPALLSAQSSAVSEGISIRNDFGYEIIGRLRDRILLFRDKYDEFEVQAFDNQMRVAWSKEMADLDRRGVQILAVIGGKNDFSVVHRVRRRGYTILRVHKYDPSANLIDSMTVKDYGERVFSPPSLEVLRSEDRNCVVVYNTAERAKLEVTCIRLDKMQVLWDKTVETEADFYESKVEAMTLGNAGDFFLISEHNNRRTKIESHEYHILHINAQGDDVRRVPLRDFLTSDVDFEYDNRNHCLVGAGLYGDKNRERAKGTFYFRAVPGDTAQVLRYEAFDDKFMSVLRRKNVEADTKGIDDAEVSQLVLRNDGGVLLVVERQHEVMRGAAAGGRGFWRDGVRAVVDFYYDDVLVVALQPDGHVQWKTVLNKKQYSQDDDGTFSSFYIFKRPDGLRFLFNDEIKYDNTCSEYVVSPLGEFDRNGLINTENQGLRLRFRDALQISASECLIPSELRNKLKLVLLRW